MSPMLPTGRQGLWLCVGQHRRTSRVRRDLPYPVIVRHHTGASLAVIVLDDEAKKNEILHRINCSLKHSTHANESEVQGWLYIVL